MKIFMRHVYCIITGVFLSVNFSTAIAADTNPPPRLTVELRDGSRVVGQAADSAFKFHSPLLGDLKLAVKDIRSIDCVATNSAKLTTVSGDLLTIWFVNSEMRLITSFGKVELPVNSIRKVTVSATGKTGLRCESLVSWWRGEGDASDSAGTNNGVVVGNVEFVQGKAGLGFGFNGSGYIRIPDSLSLHMSNELTIELWYKSEGGAGGEAIGKRNVENGPINYEVFLSPSLGITVQFNDPTVVDSDHPGNYENSDYRFGSVSGEFQHLATTFRQVTDRSLEVKTFLDGQPVRTRMFRASLAKAVSDAPVTIGVATEYPDYYYFHGIIDEVRLYNRALPDSEIREDYEAEKMN